MKRVKTLIALGLAAVMALSAGMSAMAATTSNEVTERELRNDALSQVIATEGIVLLENHNDALPIARSGKVALYGEGAYATYASSIGNAWVKTRNEFVNVYQGFLNAGYDVLTADYIEAYGEYYEENVSRGGVGRPYVIPDALPLKQEELDAVAAEVDTAVYVITRHTAEGVDHELIEDDYYLSAVEREQLAQLANTFDKTVVVITAGNIIDTKFFSEIDGLDALVVMGYGGGHAGDALVDVLNGTVSPSGKLTDTWAVNYEDYPNSATYANNDENAEKEYYTEGIYTGYRYFDTFDVTPAYAFGYGLSYTDFDIAVDDVVADAERVAVTVTVTNTGDAYSGKEVVQIYFSAPDGALEKPYQELIAFGKTDEIAPGASQTMTITFLTTEMSSYSEEQAAYILEAGDYIIRVGNSSRNTEPAAVLNLNETVVNEQLSNQTTLGDQLDELSRADIASWTDGKSADGAVKIDLDAASFVTVNHASPYDSEDVNVYVSDTTQVEYLAENTKPELYNPYTGKTYQENVVRFEGDFSNSTLLDVYNGDITVEEFVSSLTLEEMTELVGGIGSTWGKHFDVPVEGAVGFTTATLTDRMVPQITLDDGCSGLTLVKEYYTDADGNWIGMKEQVGAWALIEYRDYETLESENPGYVTWYQYPTQFTGGTTLAQTWNLDLAEAFGAAVGEEMYELNVDILLAPSLNIHTNPLGGRNFEYYSEDPVVSGLTAMAETRGLQSNPGTGASIKHFAVNNQETQRNSENNIVSERAFREIYLKGFEIAVRGAAPMTVMTSYNINNGVPAANDYDMIEDILRGEWGFDGLVETDWGGSGEYTTPMAMHAGNDLIMPGGGHGEAIISAIANIPIPFEQPVYDITENDDGTAFSETGEFIDTGYPSVTVQNWRGVVSATPAWNEFVPAAGGSSTVEREISLESYETQNIPQVVDDRVFLASLKEITEADASIDVVIDGDTVKVTYHGEYAPNTTSLGDVQKSAIRILNVMMRTQAFEQYSGKTAPSYTAERADQLIDYCVVEKD